MSGQVQKRPVAQDEADGQPSTTFSAMKHDDKDAQSLKAEMDELLDEIDEVLEANAEEFVKGYVQKNGQ